MLQCLQLVYPNTSQQTSNIRHLFARPQSDNNGQAQQTMSCLQHHANLTNWFTSDRLTYWPCKQKWPTLLTCSPLPLCYHAGLSKWGQKIGFVYCHPKSTWWALVLNVIPEISSLLQAVIGWPGNRAQFTTAMPL